MVDRSGWTSAKLRALRVGESFLLAEGLNRNAAHRKVADGKKAVGLADRTFTCRLVKEGPDRGRYCVTRIV